MSWGLVLVLPVPPRASKNGVEMSISTGDRGELGRWAVAVVAGAAIGMSMTASPKRKFDEPPLLWAICAADSGTGKSPCLRPSIDISLAIDKRLKTQFLSEKDQHETDLEAWKAIKDGGDRTPKPTPPRREYFLLSDTTIERLCENIASSPRGIIVIRDEVSAWFGSFPAPDPSRRTPCFLNTTAGRMFG